MSLGDLVLDHRYYAHFLVVLFLGGWAQRSIFALNVILDKSYIEGVSAKEVAELYGRHRLLMPDVLFYELITAGAKSRSKCFSKFPQVQNPVTLIPNVGAYFRYEYENRRPCVPITSLREDIKYHFNPGLREESFELSSELLEIRKKEEAEIEKSTRDFVERSNIVLGFFEEKNKEGEGLPIENLIDQVASESQVVKELYDQIIPKDDPYFTNRVSPRNIGTNWALFRWVQTQIIYGLMFRNKYSGSVPDGAGDNFWRRAEHDMLDSHYVLLASLAGAIATRDNGMKNIFMKISTHQGAQL